MEFEILHFQEASREADAASLRNNPFTSKPLDRHCWKEHSGPMAVFSICAALYCSQQPPMAIEYLRYGK